MEEMFVKRVGFEGNIRELGERVCGDYGLGKHITSEVIQTGYEDLNVSLKTNNGRFLVKVFARFRSEANCRRYIKILDHVQHAGVHHPKIYSTKEGLLKHMKLGKKILRLCVMDYVNGHTFYELNELPTREQIKYITRQAAIINQISLKPSPYYDSWAITNFPKEFKNKSRYLPKADREQIQQVLDEYRKLDVKKLPHCFVHGDILRTNAMHDKNGKIWIIDFSVSNYYPRIQELAVLGCDVLFDSSSKRKSSQNFRLALNEYQKNISLTKSEINALPVFLKAAHAMHIILPCYEKKENGNNTQENNYWLEQGRIGLKQLL